MKSSILVKMHYEKKTVDNIITVVLPYDQDKFNLIYEKRWNPFKDQPIKDATEACYAMRRVVNSDISRRMALIDLLAKHRRLIIFYNFDYELEELRLLKSLLNVQVAEHNGHFHESVPTGESWLYFVQYASAAEAWNCIETNVIVLYSRNYSYKTTKQAMGRIDRQNTPFVNLYYYFFTSESKIDQGIRKSYNQKKNFNETEFYEK